MPLSYVIKEEPKSVGRQVLEPGADPQAVGYLPSLPGAGGGAARQWQCVHPEESWPGPGLEV